MWIHSIGRCARVENAVGDIDQMAGIRRLAEVLVSRVAVAEMDAGLDLRRDEIDQTGCSLVDPVEQIIAQTGVP